MQPTSPQYTQRNLKAPQQPPALFSGLARAWALCIGAVALVAKPRSQCHRLFLDVKGIPSRMLQSSIRLQLGHVTGIASFGYAWRLAGQQAEIWYWPEEPAAANKERFLPCPEPLLRNALPDGLHLIKCLAGFEALAIQSGATRKTRWFATQPSELTWQQFSRDAGVDPAGLAVPAPKIIPLLAKPAKAWKLVSHAVKPISAKKWTVWAVATAVGALFFVLLAYNMKLVVHANSLHHEYDVLAKQAASTLKLQREIEALQQPIQTIAQAQPKVFQIKLMARLAQAGLFDEATKVNLQEWEYRNGRIRMQFSVPPDGFELGSFLESIERLGLFKNVRLLSGTPSQSVALQAELVPAQVAP